MSTRILAMVGSLRAGSYNRQLAEAAVKLAPEGIEIEIYEGLADVPFYNEDLDQPGAVPASADALRAAVRAADALLLVTPEYNGTVPPALKNAVDWTSRPYRSAAVIFEKPVVVIGTSFGRCGGARAHDDARKTAHVAGATVLDEITLSVPARRRDLPTPLPCATRKSSPSCRPSWPLLPRRPNSNPRTKRNLP